MATATAATYPLSSDLDTSVGTVAWTGYGNILISDNAYAQAILNNQTSQYLKAYNFGFTIPTNAAIRGIVVEIEKTQSAGTGVLSDVGLYLLRHGVIMSKANNHAITSAWPGGESFVSYGSSTDTWGIPWRASEINAWDFGLVYSIQESTGTSATARVDSVRITIYYDVGYLSNPQIFDNAEVSLFGQPYLLSTSQNSPAGNVVTSLASTPPPKITTNRDYDRSSSPIHSASGGNDLRGGMSHWRYIYDENGKKTNGDCFWEGQNIDTLWQTPTLGPLCTDGGLPAAVNLQIGTLGILKSQTDGLCVGFANAGATDIYNYSPANSWSAKQVTANATGYVGQTLHFNHNLFYPSNTGTYGYSYQTGTAAATDATQAANFYAATWTLFDGKIWAVATNGNLYVSTTGLSGTWEQRASIPGELETGALYDTIHPVVLLPYLTYFGNPALWAINGDGCWVYDDDADEWQKFRLDFPHYNYGGNFYNHGNAVTIREFIYVRAMKRNVYKIDVPQGQISDVGIGLPDGLPSAYQGEIKAMTASDRLVFALVEQPGGNNLWIAAHNGKGWHPLFTQSNTITGLTPMVVADDGTNRRLYFAGASDSVASTRSLRHIELDEMEDNPVQNSSKTYSSSGYVILPYDDFGFPEQSKTAQEFRVKLLQATTSETVTVSYRLNESTGSFTTLGSAIIVNEEVRLPFGTNHVGLEFKSIQYKLTFARGSTNTLTPILQYWVTDAVRQLEVIRGMQVHVDLSQEYRGRTTQQQIDDLWAAVDARIFGTFAWRDDYGSTHSSLVKIIGIHAAESTNGYISGKYIIDMIEMDWN